MRTALALASILAAAALASCGDDGDDGRTAPTTTGPAAAGEGSEPDRPRDPLEAAGIDPATGTHAGLAPDTRTGIAPDVAGIGTVSLASAAREAGCALRTGLPDEGRQHVGPARPVPRYGTSPPTSGDHFPIPTADGAYRNTPPAPSVVHSLEHGRVAIQYDPRLPRREQLLLKGIFEADPRGIVLFPNPRMPYEVAVTAWRNLLGCRRFAGRLTVAAILAFRDDFRGRGPERLPL